ncbi:hypothetical protein DS745_04890 [Anaerobacillus alkaliphilus]|uniref:DUF294 domain-containing protein n=1 Tax=Anaerobacillus alkaliphilus TaxID=1548597 RepID=A0A4Q0VW85_9BACI|nr:hypothetical protein DS745_04890 [Anaerobacillus alkaliphilus]
MIQFALSSVGNSFDRIKKEVLFPFHHCLQLLAIKDGIFEGTPLQRITELAKLNAINEDFAGELMYAYSILL